MTVGGRNLIIMGVVAALVALTTTSVAVAVYHNSGDIYLDRSRPGYLPDDEEIEDEPFSDDYELPETVVLSSEILEEYLKHLEAEIKAVEAYENPFGPEVLSDSHLGISEEE